MTSLKLITHVRGDGDLLEAWFRHYLRLGVGEFQVIVHGPRDENRELYDLASRYPVRIEDAYEDEFDVREKKRRLDRLLERLAGQWVLMTDSDEFLELPLGGLGTTIRLLQWAGADVLYAPMLQHFNADGTLATPPVIEDPFAAQPLCSVDLYRRMGSQAAINKYPLFYCRPGTRLSDGGNHNPPEGCGQGMASLRGVTHHFKFRQCVLERLNRRADSGHTFRHESVGFLGYLESHDGRLPTDGAFPYSRRELFRRGLLRRPGWTWLKRKLGGQGDAP